MTPDKYFGPQTNLPNYAPHAPHPRAPRTGHPTPLQVPRAPHSRALKSPQDRFVAQQNLSILQRLFKRPLTALLLCGSKNSRETF